MRRTSRILAPLAVVLVASAGSGCGQLTTWFEQEVQHRDGTGSTGSGSGGSAPGTAGTSGAAGGSGTSDGSASCVAEMGTTGVCKRCYDASGVLVHEDCPPPDATGSGGSTGTPPPLPPKCAQTTDASGQSCKTCWDPVTGQQISNDCVPGSTGAGGTGGTTQTCIAVDDGGPTSCKDAATWKQYGVDRCGQQNLALADVKLAIACDGGYSTVSYLCCGPSTTPAPVVTCDSYYDSNGALCKQCRNESGAVISLDCQGGKQPPNEICDVKTNADGSQCKTCYYSDGSTVSSCTAP